MGQHLGHGILNDFNLSWIEFHPGSKITERRFRFPARTIVCLHRRFYCRPLARSTTNANGTWRAWQESKESRDDDGEKAKTRQRPTLPPRLQGSTIGAGGLNCRVRNGNGCCPSAIATGKLKKFSRVPANPTHLALFS